MTVALKSLPRNQRESPNLTEGLLVVRSRSLARSSVFVIVVVREVHDGPSVLVEELQKRRVDQVTESSLRVAA